MSELPENWIEATLRDVSGIVMGQSPDSSTYNDQRKGLPFFQGKAEFGELYPTVKKWCTQPQKIAEADDILLSVRAPVGPTNLALEKCCIGRGLAAIRVDAPISQKYLLHHFRNIEPWLMQQGTGSTFTAISGSFIRDLKIPLAPLNEQKRITDKLDKLLARVNSCQSHLERVPQILKRFRQSVLAAATSGRLTEEWREEHHAIENASGLLKRILAKRLANTQRQTERNHLENLLSNLSTDIISSEDLPESWAFTSIDYIGLVCNGSTPSRKMPNYWNGDIPWISSGEVRNNIIKEARERITQEGYKNSSVRLLPKGTVLLAMIGEGKTRGQAAMLDIEACINQNMAAIVLDHGLVNSEYLWYWLQSVYEANRRVGSGSGPQALNCQRVRALPCILPPLEEQAEIVRRVEKLFAYADQLESRYESAMQKVESLTPSLLAKAFRGELVAQDPNDEPAAVLLERVRAARGELAIE